MSNIYLKSDGVPAGSLDLDEQFYDSNMNLLSGDYDPTLAVYGDIEVRSQPVFGGGGGVLFEPDGGGFPDPDDYERTVNPDGTISISKKSFLSSSQSQPLDSMVESVNNGRISSINVVNDVIGDKKGDIVIHKDNQDTSVKGLLEKNSLNDIFFSDMNMKVLQDTIRYKVHEITKKVISVQSQNELYIIMRSIMLQFANFRTDVDNLADEIKRLNKKVVEYSVDNISSNVLQHDGYIKDLSKLPDPMDRPVVSNSSKNFTYDISNLL